MAWKLITNIIAKTVGLLSYLSEYSQRKKRCTKPRGREMKMKKKHIVGILCFCGQTEPCIQATALCEVFFTQLDQKTRMSSSAGCYITQLDFSHSLIHFSAYLYPFKSRDLTALLPSQAGTQTKLMNNRREDAAWLLKENNGDACCVWSTSVNGILINQVPSVDIP